MSDQREYTGSSVSYYSIDVNDPINENSDPYTAECQDIIEALKLDFNEGNVLKAIWRRAAARLGRSKKGYDEGLYDAEKIVFYGQRLVAIEERHKRITAAAVKSVLDGEKSIAEAIVGAVVQDVAEQITDSAALPYDADQIANSNKSATHRDGGGQLYKVCDMSRRWLRYGNKCWFFASDDPKAVPEGLKPLKQLETDPYGPRDAEGWYTWNGDETMRPAGKVDCMMRGGNTRTFQADTCWWDHRQVPGDIVKWRPAQ